MYARHGGFLAEIDKFDARFFALAPREASFMDPQQRLLLEVCWEALEDAGLVPAELSGSRTGVFVGISTRDYGDLQQKDLYTGDFYANTGGALSIAANRVSYLFDFRGPSMAVDTACSSSLVAAHLACHSIWRGESQLALVGGVNCILTPETTITFSKGSMLSPDGRCKTFDADANGYVRGEGMGCIVLKPLNRAQSDGDPIYAVILASGVNQDGQTQGMTVPSRASQEALLRELYADVPLEHLIYIEAHGTGTPVGDPIEANAIGSVLGISRPAGRCLKIGSAKSNIGHLEAASGMAGLIKTAMVLKHRRIPASLHFRTPNPRISFEDLRLRVQTASGPFPVDATQAIAGVNSFGFGGTNAHVVLQEAPAPVKPPTETTAAAQPARLVPVSGRTPEALHASALNLADFLTSETGKSARFDDICYSASVRRSHFEHRAAFAVSSHEELASALRSFAATTKSNTDSATPEAAGTRKLAFVFSGMGPQWFAMGRELLRDETVFCQAVERCDELFRRYAGWSIMDELLADEARSRMREAEVAQPANFVLQVGLTELWASWGIVPDAIVGHSAGEVAAAVAAGGLSLDDGVRVIFHRSRLQQRSASLGRMLSVDLTAAEAHAVVEPYGALVSVAAVNSVRSVTLSGDSEALAVIAQSVEGRGGFSRFLDVNVPYHSHFMDPLETELRESLSGLDTRTASLPMYSTVSGTLLNGTQLDAHYWWLNIRKPVEFALAVEQLAADGYDTFVEVAPHPVLAHSIHESLKARNEAGVVVASLRRGRERSTMLDSLGALYTRGHAVKWRASGPDKASFVQLPTYPWQRESFWQESEVSTSHRLPDPVHPLLHRRLESPGFIWDTNVTPSMPPYLKDHCVRGSVVYPAAAYIEMALGAARAMGCELPLVEDLELKRALVLGRESVQQLQFTFDAQESAFAVHSRPRESGQPWTLHVTGKLRLNRGVPEAQPRKLELLQRRCTAEVDRQYCYLGMKAQGLEYGPRFQGVETLWQGKREAVGRIKAPEALGDLAGYAFHPAILDACFHVLMGAIFQDGGGQSGTYLPVRIGRIRVHKNPVGDTLWSYAKLTDHSATGLSGDVQVFDQDGGLLMELTSFKCQHVPESRAVDDWRQHVFESQWFAKALSVPRTVGRSGGFPSPVQMVGGCPTPDELKAQFDDKRYEVVEPAMEALCGAYAAAALVELGWAPEKGDKVDVPSLSARLGIASQHERLLGRLLEILCEDKLLRKTDAGWTVTRAYRPKNTRQIWNKLSHSHPDYEATLTMLDRCGQHLADVLIGKQDPLQLLFPDGSMTPLERLYGDSQFTRVYNFLVGQVIAGMLKDLPPGRTIRILEVGAGTGSTTSSVLPILPDRRTEYIYTDLSSVFLEYGKRKFRDNPFVDFQVLDIERSPEEQGFAPHSFDLVLAANVLHTTKDLREALANVRRLLASEGTLVLLEWIRAMRYSDLTFGLLKGWWRFEDKALRGERPWLPRPDWELVLRESGFGEVASVADASDPGQPLQAVFAARNSGMDSPAGLAEKPSQPRAGARWLIFADDQGIGRGLAEWLQSCGAVPCLVSAGTSFTVLDPQHIEIRPDNPDDMTGLLELAGAPLDAIVHLWSLDSPPPERGGLADLETAQRLGCYSVLSLVQTLAKSGRQDQPRLWLATRGAHQINAEDGPPAVAQSPLWGLGRVIANEHPNLRCTLVDLDSAGDAPVADALQQELSADEVEQEVALRGDSRYILRVVRSALSVPPVDASAVSRNQPRPPYLLEASRPGVLDSLVLRETKRRKPGPGELEIQVCAAGLNFRDVMKAMGLYPDEDGNDLWLGDECAGRVVRAGRSVAGLQVGDEVIAVAPGALRTFVTIPAAQALRKPAHLSFDEAATIPIVFMTVLYALKHLAHLTRGERILIHAAAGGVGLAAVQLAQDIGAEIFATAGSPEKRRYLRSLGVRHVMDSRSQNFADQVMKATDGKGVGVVLNSLAGEFITNSLALLEPTGRFVELGKIDIYQDHKLDLAHFKNGRSFFAVDLGWLLLHKPQVATSLLEETMAMFEARTFRALPVTVFPISAAANAFRHMAQARHIGKISLSLADDSSEAPVLPALQKPPIFSGKATYLVTGGLTGFGLAMAQWLVRQGVRHLVLAGRRGMTGREAEEAVRRMGAAGARVKVAQVDVAEADQVDALVDEIGRTMPPLRGIFHAAMVLDDGYLMQMSELQFARVMAPKVTGTWNLHAATLDKPLDCFVMFSSVSSVTGAPGQGNYCAANAFLDAFAHYRRSRNLPALTVNWGLIEDVGYVSRNASVARYLERQGLVGLMSSEAETILEELLRSDRSQVAAIRADFQKLAASYHSEPVFRRLSLILRQESSGAAAPNESDGERGAVLRAIRAATPAELPAVMQSALRRALARVLKVPEDRIGPDQAFGSLGLDSLMAAELETLVKSDFGTDLSLGFLAGGDMTLRKFTSRLLEHWTAKQAN
jgi:acyl transferase domain-containing protein/SAM-dependent methyltransferase/acyl carrier protein